MVKKRCDGSQTASMKVIAGPLQNRPSFIYFLFLVCFLSCSDSSYNITDSPPPEDLILNSSFETYAGPSLEGWIVEEESAVSFSHDAPKGGGNWAVAIHEAWIPQTYKISYLIPASDGSSKYRFSFWAKSPIYGANARLWIKEPDLNKIVKVIPISSSYWVPYSTTFTIGTNTGDTIVVELDGGSTEVAAGSALYDLVELKKFD